jgi:hypothetical protein
MKPLVPNIIEEKYARIRRFCLEVLELVHEETTNWAEEFTRSHSKFEEDIRTGIFPNFRASKP